MHGNTTKGKRIPIDDKQRVTALMNSLLAYKIITKSIKIIQLIKLLSILTLKTPKKSFQVKNPTIKKEIRWILDISILFSENIKSHCKDIFNSKLY